jgi:hypothetical protein
MQPSKLVTEDMFEKAREAFFGPTKALSQPNDYLTEFFKTRYEAPANKKGESSSD